MQYYALAYILGGYIVVIERSEDGMVFEIGVGVNNKNNMKSEEIIGEIKPIMTKTQKEALVKAMKTGNEKKVVEVEKKIASGQIK